MSTVKTQSKPRKKKALSDRASDYARAVIAGEILTGRLVRLACERHLRDIATGSARGIRWDLAAANLAIDFFEQVLRLNGGEHEGKPFILQPWQAFIVGSINGWMGADGYRRFRTSYAEAAKGNGKSPLSAGQGLKCLVADGEPRAEVYSFATKYDQAIILFRDAVAMVDQSPELAACIDKSGSLDKEWNLAHHASGSWFRPIGSDRKTQSGLRPHCSLVDEVHEHTSSAVIDMAHAAKKGRRQPLVFEITNSGSDRSSVCRQHHDYSVQILEGLIEDDSWFAYICCLDPCDKHRREGQDQPVDGCPDCDDWRDESKWLKANPNLGVSIHLQYLRDQVRMAGGMPALANKVKRLNFCIWTQVTSRAIPDDRWKACAREMKLEDFHGRACCAALDIGSTSDFTALVLLFPHDDEETIELDSGNPDGPPRTLTRRSYSAVPFFWLPENPVKRDERTSEMIETWRARGLIRTTPGTSVDYGQVLLDIEEILAPFTLLKFAIDRGWQGNWIASQLVDRYADLVVSFVQGILSMNPPFRELLELLKTGRLHHPNHPVLNWMAGNCAAEERNGLIKPSKDQSPEKIDGISALTMALGVAMSQPVDNGSGGFERW